MTTKLLQKYMYVYTCVYIHTQTRVISEMFSRLRRPQQSLSASSCGDWHQKCSHDMDYREGAQMMHQGTDSRLL